MNRSQLQSFIIQLLTAIVIAFSTNLQAQDNQANEDDLVYVTAVAWSHDGSKIAAVGIRRPALQGYVRVFDAQTGQPLYTLDPNPGGFTSVTWSPDDRLIAAGGYDQVIWVIDMETRNQVATLRGHQATVSSLDWNGDGTRLVSVGNWDDLVILWDMTSYEQTRSIRLGNPWAVAFSPDDQSIAVGGRSGLFVFPSALNVGEGRELNQYELANRYVGDLAWNSDGSRIAFGTQTPDVQAVELYVIDSNTGNQVSNSSTREEALFGVDWSPDGSLIATHSIDGFVRIWDVNSATQLQSFPGTTRYPEQIGFSPYGGRLAYGGSIPSDLAASSAQIGTEDVVQTLANSAVQIVVPAPSLERLQAIAEACNAPAAVEQVLTADIQAEDLNAFVAQVEALPEGTIPPACAADLIAVAEALQSQ
jgi:WD40 repeat protein